MLLASSGVLLQYANTKAPGGVDPLFLFRAQRMLQRKDIYLFATTTQIAMAGERLEIAFDTLYPGQVRTARKCASLLYCLWLVWFSTHARIHPECK